MIYAVIKYEDGDFYSIDYLTFDKEDAERAAKASWGDPLGTSYSVEEVDSASMSKEFFEYCMKRKGERNSNITP